ncbi:hypothetical protein [Spirosoma foliorum]|uniref:DUF3784 domain-containing protein n=1 Tax=Spirosoma foliorum TaxID=2710596 RepID=A0A7G5H0A9_9BACT|nr:hypothetical protein [Spirosoma foliorum]QMW04551.1 hypothetical protein H3H32_06320 [Spirosoma foliorum]
MGGPHIVGVILFLVIGFIINSLFSYLLRKRIIDSGQIDKEALEVLLKPIGSTTESLKWGLLLLFGGLGLVILEFIPYEVHNSSLPYGIEAICLALGFLTYYLWMRK